MRFARQLTSSSMLAIALAAAPADSAMRILTYPTGLVVGDLEVAVDLGPEGRQAELFLDGSPVCRPTPEAPTCSVDLGPDPHIHLLELIRDAERVDRWINRPGQEAELTLLPLPSDGLAQCEAEISWAHPERQSPAELEVSLAGSQPEILSAGHLVRFPCPQPNESQLLVALAVFPDGRRVEAVAAVGGFAEETSVGLQAVPLVAGADAESACETDASVWGQAAERIEKSGFEVVIVLDPGASYVPLRASGWDRGRLQNTTSTTKVFDAAVRQGGESDAPEPRNSWLKAKATIFDADRLWYIAPDEGLHRVNGFAAGKPNWLDLLFKFGLASIPGKPRIADAVAASGLVAAAGPRRRAVVLLLGNNAHKRDGSRFTPHQAREYLAEVNVPLLVLRNGKRREDGWPAGLPALDMEAMSRSLKKVRQSLDAQCIGWFPPEWTPSQVAAAVPTNIRLAGRGEIASDDLESVWARAEVAQAAVPEIEGLQIDRLDITAMTVVVSALDTEGRPVGDLAAEDLRVLEDGEPVVVLDLSSVAADAEEPAESEIAEAAGSQPSEAVPPAGGDETPDTKELPVAIYIDRTVGGGFDQRQALRAVAEQVGRLSALGPVEVVVAEKQEVRTLAGPTREIEELTAALDGLAGRKTAVHAIERIRRRFVTDVRPIPDRFGGASRDRKEFGSRVAFAARTAASEEDIIISRALEQLRFWAQRETGQRAGLLVVVGVGFDENPAAFYGPWIEKLEPHNVFDLREDLRAKRKEASVNALGSELASTGWRVLAVAGQATSSSAASVDSRTDKFISFLSNSTDAVHAVDTEFLLVDPIDAQRNLAEPSGGGVAIGPAGLDRALDQASGWYLLTYQVERPPDGGSHTLTLETDRPGIEVKTTKLVTAATSEGQAEARVRRLLGGATDRGELVVELAPGPPSNAGDAKRRTAQIEATVHFGSVASLIRTGADLRVSIAVVAEGTEPRVVHRLEKLDPASAGWIYTFPVEWPADAASRLAVTVEEMASGLWGGAEIPLPAG